MAQKNDHSLGFYDLETGAEQARVPLDPFPHEFAVSTDRRRAYCCHFGVALAEDAGPGGNTVSVVDLAVRKRVGTLDCGADRRPHGIALDAAGRLYVLSEATSRLLIWRDPVSGGCDSALPTDGDGSHWITVTRDGNLAFASNMGSNSVTALFPGASERPPVTIPVGMRPEGSVLDAAEARLYAVNRESAEISVIDTGSLSLIGAIPTRPGPVRICWDDRGRLLVPLYHDQSLAIIDPSEPAAQVHVDLPAKPISISFDPVTRQAFASTLADQVCIIDVAEPRLLHSIATRAGPDPTAVVRLESD